MALRFDIIVHEIRLKTKASNSTLGVCCVSQVFLVVSCIFPLVSLCEISRVDIFILKL